MEIPSSVMHERRANTENNLTDFYFVLRSNVGVWSKKKGGLNFIQRSMLFMALWLTGGSRKVVEESRPLPSPLSSEELHSNPQSGRGKYSRHVLY